MTWLTCQTCGREAFLYLGACAACAPIEHARRQAEADVWHRRFVEYRTATGKEPLDDWAAFETWVDGL